MPTPKWQPSAELADMVEQAKLRGLWIRSPYQDIWFTPCGARESLGGWSLPVEQYQQLGISRPGGEVGRHRRGDREAERRALAICRPHTGGETVSRPMIPVVLSALRAAPDIYGTARVACYNSEAEANEDIADWYAEGRDEDDLGEEFVTAYNASDYEGALSEVEGLDYLIEAEGHAIELPEFIEHDGKKYRILLEEVNG